MRQIKIPFFLEHLPLYKGLPVPFFVPFKPDEIEYVPDFKTISESKQLQCMGNRLCGVCGKALLKNVSFAISGPQDVAAKITKDPPMHRECAEFVLQTCPHFYLQKNEPSDNAEFLKKAQEKNPNIIFGNPDDLYLVRITAGKIQINTSGAGKVFKYKYDLVEEYRYKDGILFPTGEKSKELR